MGLARNSREVGCVHRPIIDEYLIVADASEVHCKYNDDLMSKPI